MPVTLPSAPPTTQLDAGTDDPRQARSQIFTLSSSFSTLLGQINSIGITQPGNGIEIVASGAGTKDLLAVKLDGSSLARSASGLKVADAGITLAMLAPNGASNGQIISFNGTAWVVSSPAASGNQKLKQAVITSVGNSNWTVPSGVTEAKVTCVGGGGSGGNAPATNNWSVGGGGGGGGTAIKWVTGLTPGSQINCTVGGSEGTTYFGTAGSPFCRATGGSGGSSTSTTGGAAAIGGGAGGVGNVGDILIAGQDGGAGSMGGSTAIGGIGGCSTHGGGGTNGASASALSGGGSGKSYGGGGGGGAKWSNSGTASGGGGAQGVIIIEYVQA